MFKLPIALFVALTVGLAGALPAAPEPSQDVPATTAVDGEPGFVLVQANVTTSLSVEKRAEPGVYFCKNANFNQPCSYVANIEFGACYGTVPSYMNVISSFGPDQGIKCYAYADTRCKDIDNRFGPIKYPGVQTPAQFVQGGRDFHDRINSFICWRLPPIPGN